MKARREGIHKKRACARIAVRLTFLVVTACLLDHSVCTYVIEDEVLSIRTKGSSDTLISGTIPRKTDSEGSYAEFDGSGYIDVGDLPPIDDITSGVHIRFKAAWYGFRNWSRIFDCGQSGAYNSFFVANQGATSTLYVGMHDASNNSAGDTPLSNVLTTGQIEEWDITIASNADGNAVTMIDVRDGNRVYRPARTASSALTVTTRPQCYIGKSLSPDELFYGKIYYVKVETLAQKVSLIEFDAAKMQ